MGTYNVGEGRVEMFTDDSLITLFGPKAPEDAYTTEERLAFLQGYHAALAASDPARPLGILDREPPPGLESYYRAGEAKAQRDLEEKRALDATFTVISAI